MRRAAPLVVVAFALVATPLALAEGTAPPSASTLGSAAPSGAASSSAASPPLPPLTPPDMTSPMPKRPEWKDAAAVTFPGLGAGAAKGCTARLLREWLRVECKVWQAHNVALVAGTPTAFAGFADRKGAYVDIQMALRRGDRRVVVVNAASEEGYNGPSGRSSVLVLSEIWLARDPAPTVVLD